MKSRLTTLKRFVLSLSTKAKVFIAIGIVFTFAGTAGIAAAFSDSNDFKSSVATEVSVSHDQGDSESVVLAETDESTSLQDKNNQNTTSDEQGSSEKPSENQTSNSSRQSSGTKPQTENQSTTPKPKYNLSDGWYFAASGASGPFNLCWPEAFTEDNEARCTGASMDFVGIGVARTAEAADEAAYNQVVQKAAAAHADPRRGGPVVESTLLTEALCAQYGLSCGRW